MGITAGTCDAGGSRSDDQPGVTIGSDNFYESQLMAEIYAQVSENGGHLLATVVNEDEFISLLNEVSARLTTEELSNLGVEVEENDVEDVASEWLTQQGLLG